tara:strand:- start:4760 stop:5335 length:576 start_codon:yes stop_codon:yes gene_type:complete
MANISKIELHYSGHEIPLFCPACGSTMVVLGAGPGDSYCNHIIAVFVDIDDPDSLEAPIYLDPIHEALFSSLEHPDLEEFMSTISSPSIMFMSVVLYSDMHGPNSMTFTIGIDYSPASELVGINIQRLDKLLRTPDGLTQQLKNAPSEKWQLEAEHVLNAAHFAKDRNDLDELRILDTEAVRLLDVLETSD